jgi:hypothetical protein
MENSNDSEALKLGPCHDIRKTAVVPIPFSRAQGWRGGCAREEKTRQLTGFGRLAMMRP